MLEENWCGNFSKPLAVFNKAFIRRLGKGLHPYIQLEGSEKDCAYCINMEARLFYDNGLYESDEVLLFKPYSENRGVYAAGEWVDANIPLYKKLSENGCLLFFTSGNVQRANHYDVTGCEAYSFREQFLKASDMPCEEGIFDIVMEKYPDVLGYDIGTATNNTILCHYSQYDDDIIHADDFKWVEEGKEEKTDDPSLNLERKPETAEKEEQHTVTVNEPVETTTEEPCEEPAPQERDQSATDEDKEQKLTDKDNPVPAEENAEKDDFRTDAHDTPDDKEPEKESAEETDTVKEPAKDEKVARVKKQQPEADKEKPATKKTPKKKRNAYGLTEEDERYNQMLLSEIRKEYTELLKYIISLKSSIWKPIERIVRNSLETNDYSESVILKYLELSKDITTDLYTRLYTVTEPIQRKFEDGVKREYKKLVCYNCSAQWKVDVTFMGKDHDESECPICQSSIGYDKD